MRVGPRHCRCSARATGAANVEGMEEILFAFISVGVAALGIGMVLAAAHIERKRQERHTEQFGDH